MSQAGLATRPVRERVALGTQFSNGRSAGRMQDVELVELATAQVGLAFENELLRRQIERSTNN